MKFVVLDDSEGIAASEVWFSLGGGFIEKLGRDAQDDDREDPNGFEFRSSHDLLKLCRDHSCTIAEIA